MDLNRIDGLADAWWVIRLWAFIAGFMAVGASIAFIRQMKRLRVWPRVVAGALLTLMISRDLPNVYRHFVEAAPPSVDALILACQNSLWVWVMLALRRDAAWWRTSGAGTRSENGG